MARQRLGRLEVRRLLGQRRALDRTRAVADVDMAELLAASFTRWNLTRSERDVAAFAFKGLSINEIASLRHTRRGTVKGQLATVYRKAGVENRAGLVGRLVEALTAGIVLEGP